MEQMKDLGTVTVARNGSSLVIRVPREWLSHFNLIIGSPVFSVLDLDDVLRVHLKEQKWSLRSRIRMINGNGHIVIGREHADKLRLKKDAVLSVSVDLDIGVLLIRRT